MTKKVISYKYQVLTKGSGVLVTATFYTDDSCLIHTRTDRGVTLSRFIKEEEQVAFDILNEVFGIITGDWIEIK